MIEDMTNQIRDILRQYWGYASFRSLQEDIILSVLSGRDTLALMPTGGGKSITYQVPGLLLEGTCLVVTPLIALMKDQVEDLRGRGIAGEAIYTGKPLDEIESIINKCIYNHVDFLYISPERLASENFRGKLKQMSISFIAVDEAHCISQWGYDFRPSYLRIAEVRAFFPKIPVLALTATATPEVVEDIQQQLKFKTSHVLSTSFRRENIAYVVRECENKVGELQHILTKTKGSAIVYVRKRKRAEELALLLASSGIKADFYHAGLSSMQREQKQENWKGGEVPVIVATNAFGMGIDKADVRAVVHYDIPDSPEAYFQEAGRVGRDGLRAYAVLLYNQGALTALKGRVEKGFPDKGYVKQVYEALANHFQVGEGGGEGQVFEFDVAKFAVAFKLDQAKVLSSVDILGVAGYLECTTAIHSRSRVMITVLRDQLYDIELGDPLLDRIMIALMRYYAGIFVQEIFVDEMFIAAELEVSASALYEGFLALSRRKIIRYVPGDSNPYILYLQPRYPLSYITLSKAAYEDRKQSYTRKIKAMIGYIEACETCRQLYLMNYFGQKDDRPCTLCDLCVKKKRLKKGERQTVDATVLQLLSGGSMELRDLVHAIEHDPEQVIERLRILLDENKIRYVSHTRLERV